MRKPLRFTAHARVALEERLLERGWIERAVFEPEWQETDPNDPSVNRRFVALPERGGRVLRVVLVESATEIRILTAFLDRRARRPQ
jgi:hypothetical protein